jgi:hypothetical protein
MCFGSSLRVTRAYWKKCCTELTDIITQLGCPTLFFFFSITNTKYPNLHNLMRKNENYHGSNQHHITFERLSSNPILFPYLCIIDSIDFYKKSSKNILEINTFGTGSCCPIMLMNFSICFFFLLFYIYLIYLIFI